MVFFLMQASRAAAKPHAPERPRTSTHPCAVPFLLPPLNRPSLCGQAYKGAWLCHSAEVPLHCPAQHANPPPFADCAAGVPRRRGPPAQDLAHPSRRVAFQHPGQDWRQLEPEVRAPTCTRSSPLRFAVLALPVHLCAHARACSPRGHMYAELLPDILASRVPKTAEGTPYPVAGEHRMEWEEGRRLCC